jgi:T5orf172 domain
VLTAQVCPMHSARSARDAFPLSIRSSHIVHVCGRDTRASEMYDPETPSLPSDLVHLVDVDDPDIEYVAKALTDLRIAGLDVTDPTVFRMAVDLGHKQAHLAEDDAALQPVTEARIKQGALVSAVHARLREQDPEPVVYYMRTGSLCKIGFTKNVVQRIITLGAEELLVVEPGDRKLERARHRQFKHLRSTREWFRYELQLAEHVRCLQETFMAEVAAA